MTTWSTRAIGITAALIFAAGAAAAQEGASAPPELAQQDNGPFVLRGSALPPAAATATAMDPRRWQVAAGDELWLVDAAAGIAVACILRSTHRVGERVISCRTGDLPRIVTD